MTRRLNITALIDQRPVTPYQWMIFAICALTMVVDGFDAQAIGYVAPSLVKSMNLTPQMLGPIFTAGLFGMALGNLAFGLLSDRLGRRVVLILSLFLFGALTLAKALAQTGDQILVLQFLAGLGIGGAYPNAIALASEYAPGPRRSVIVTGIAIGYLVGTLVGGFLAAVLVPVYGWRAVFVIGGVIPLIIGAFAIAGLPNSIRQLVLKNAPDEQIARIVRRLAPDALSGVGQGYAVDELPASGFPVASLFRQGRGVYTVLIWTTVFSMLMATYFVFSWLPTLFNQAGLPVQLSVFAATAFPLGSGIGSVVLAPVLKRPGALLAVSATCALFMATLALMGHATSSYPLLIAVVFVCGLGNGAQGITHALNVAVYPTLIRSTGVGWATGIGRLGSMVGPLLGGVLIGWKWDLVDILYAAAIPAGVAACATAAMYLLPSPRALLQAAFAGQSSVHAPVLEAQV